MVFEIYFALGPCLLEELLFRDTGLNTSLLSLTHWTSNLDSYMPYLLCFPLFCLMQFLHVGYLIRYGDSWLPLKWEITPFELIPKRHHNAGHFFQASCAIFILVELWYCIKFINRNNKLGAFVYEYEEDEKVEQSETS